MYHSGNLMIDPHVLIQKAHVQPGMHVADLGCGSTGHVLFPLAKHIGEEGMVYAVDILKDVLVAVQKRAASHGLVHLHTVWSDIEQVGHTAIPPQSLDIAFLINTLVQATDQHAMLDEAYRLLKDKARLVVVEWTKKGIAVGPSDDRYVDMDAIHAWATSHGFVVQEACAMGPYHTGVVFYKHD